MKNQKPRVYHWKSKADGPVLLTENGYSIAQKPLINVSGCDGKWDPTWKLLACRFFQVFALVSQIKSEKTDCG